MKRAKFILSKKAEHTVLNDFLSPSLKQSSDLGFAQRKLLEEFKLYISYEAKTAELRYKVLENILSEMNSGSQETKTPQIHDLEKNIDCFDLSAWSNKTCPACGHLVWVRIHRSFWQKLTHPYKGLYQCLKCHHKFWLDNQLA